MLDQRVDVADLGAGALGDAETTGAVEDFRVTTFLLGHRKHDGFGLGEVLLFFGADLHVAHAGHHLHDVAEGTHLLHLRHLREEVLEVEVGLLHLLGQTLGFLVVDDLLGLLDEGDDVTHAQDTLGHAVGVERVEVRRLFTRAHVADRDARDGLHRQRGATTGVAVELGQDDAGEGRGFVELGGYVDGLLAEGGVGDEEDLVRLEGVADAADFLHQVAVDLQATGGVDDDEIRGGGFGFLDQAAHHRGDIGRGAVGTEIKAFVLGEGLELVDGRRATQVGGDEGRLPDALLLDEVLGELRGAGGLARALKADEEHAQRATRVDRALAFAEELRELVGHDLDGHLARVDGLDDRLAEAGDLDALGEVLGDLEIDVGGHQRRAHLVQGRRDVLFRELREPPEVAEGLGKFVGEVGEHGMGRRTETTGKGKKGEGKGLGQGYG